MRYSQPLVQLRGEALIIGADAFFINQLGTATPARRTACPGGLGIALLGRASSLAAREQTASRDRTARVASRSVGAQVGSAGLAPNTVAGGELRSNLSRPLVRHCASDKNFLGLDAPGPTLAAELDS